METSESSLVHPSLSSGANRSPNASIENQNQRLPAQASSCLNSGPCPPAEHWQPPCWWSATCLPLYRSHPRVIIGVIFLHYVISKLYRSTVPPFLPRQPHRTVLEHAKPFQKSCCKGRPCFSLNFPGLNALPHPCKSQGSE